MSSEDKESQEDELLALASIYDEDEFKRAQDVQGGETRISVAVPQNFRVSLSGNFTGSLENSKLEYTVSFLPPVVLNFEFPADYPSTSPPLFILSCKWLSQAQLTALCRHLDNLWEENRGSVVLFAWMQFLKEETLAFLNITSPFEPEITEQEKQPKEEDGCYDIRDAASAQKESSDTSTVEDVESLSILIKEILDFDQSQKEKNFNCKMFTCNICFSVKQGSECMDFKDCRHVYCKICLKNYFEIQIKDGQVHCLNCPEPECSSVATPGQVKELVEEKLFALYDRLLLQSSLDLMADVVYCPRPSCQTPVMQDPSCTMGICSQCNYAFCTLCKMTYHGVSPCKVTAEKLADLRNEYLQADEATQRFLEQRYGKRVIQKALEEMESKKWLENNSKSCPCCSTPIEKLNGCNRMRCTACMQYFCWLCMGVLSRINPYKHFSDPDSPCFNLHLVELFTVVRANPSPTKTDEMMLSNLGNKTSARKQPNLNSTKDPHFNPELQYSPLSGSQNSLQNDAFLTGVAVGAVNNIGGITRHLESYALLRCDACITHIQAAAAAATGHSATSSILLLTAPVNTPRSPELFIPHK